ncbi:MAG: hypothetical protein LAP39_11075 [Acidobacteriia bacterium]|nr:hypothetical protein [Terriglobia bacterium]
MPRFWRRGSGKRETRAARSIIAAPQSRLAAAESSQIQPIISVTCSPGTLTAGPTVAMGIKLAGEKGLLIDMRADEAYDLANELLTAVRRSERKYELKFGTE